MMRLKLWAIVLCSGVGAFAAFPSLSWAWAPELYRLDVSLSLRDQSSELLGLPSDEPNPVKLVTLGYALDFLRTSEALKLSLTLPELGQPTDLSTSTDPFEDDTIETLDFDIPIVRTSKVDRHVKFFSFHIRDRFEQWLGRLERYRPMAESIFEEFNLPADLVFLSLVESGFSPHAVSRAKAVGPWQFMKGTARTYGLRVDKWVDERRDPVKSTLAAAQYLRDLYYLFGSWPLAMAAYNAGEGRVGRALARSQGDTDFWDLTDTRHIKRETKEYVPRFLAAVLIAKDPDRFGLTVLPQLPVEYEEVLVTRPLHLRTAARAGGIPYEELKALNPELRLDLTPPDPIYLLKVPVGSKETLLANMGKYHDWKRVHATRYKVRRGDTLTRLASRYGVTAESILEANVREKSYRPRPGDWLLIPKPLRAGKAVPLISQASARSAR